MMRADERQVGGAHYKDDGAYEHWNVVAALGWDYFTGQITKYLWRWRRKGGVGDLKKAAHFLQKYIEIEEAREASKVAAKGFGSAALSWSCGRCGTVIEGKIPEAAISEHGDCAGAGYVNQD